MTSTTYFQTPPYNFASTHLDITGPIYTLETSDPMKGHQERQHAPFLCYDGLKGSHKRLRPLGRVKLHPRLHNIQRVEG